MILSATAALAALRLQDAGDWAFLIAGIAVVAFTTSSALKTLVVTRDVRSVVTQVVGVSVRTSIMWVARRSKDYERRDRINAWVAPLLLIGLLCSWLILYLIGYSLIIQADSEVGFSNSIRQSGSSLFTLGFAASHTEQLTLVDFVAAATGPIIIGLLVGYLPALYAAYNRREVDVAVLHARAGEPNWGPEILARHATVYPDASLDALWASWERWAADVGESHSTYRILIHTRSARPNRPLVARFQSHASWPWPLRW